MEVRGKDLRGNRLQPSDGHPHHEDAQHRIGDAGYFHGVPQTDRSTGPWATSFVEHSWRVFHSTALVWSKNTKRASLNVAHFVAHKTWRRNGVSPHRPRAHRVQRGEPFRGRLVLGYSRFNLFSLPPLLVVTGILLNRLARQKKLLLAGLAGLKVKLGPELVRG